MDIINRNITYENCIFKNNINILYSIRDNLNIFNCKYSFSLFK